MTDRPILMSAPMVRALLREIEQPGTGKTQTRRLAWQFVEIDEKSKREGDRIVRMGLWPTIVVDRPTIWQSVKPGDRLYVREPVRWSVENDNFYFEAGVAGCGNRAYREWRHGRNRPPRHMHRWASRITLVVAETKMERVQEISEEDARLEGIGEPYLGDQDPPFECDATMVSRYMQYRNLWPRLHTKPGARWEDNPEVVAITVSVHQQNIDAMERAA